MRHLARILAVALLGTGLAACSDDGQEACAAPAPAVAAPAAPAAVETTRPRQPSRPQQPRQQRTTSKVQDKTRSTSGTNSGSGKRTTTINPNWKSTTKPTKWGDYKTDRNWSKPYRSGYPAAPQPVIIHQYGYDYRTYPGYYGWYPVGVYPVGYGAKYGCVADEEKNEPEQAPPSPAPTVTVTATPTPTETRSPTPTPTPTETPR
jgi:hypothetical protein